jgi:predicted dehydrogenase
MSREPQMKGAPDPRGPTLAIVGCGRWGSHILRDLQRLGCRVFVVDVSSHAREAARVSGATTCFESLAALPPVAGIVIATPASSHAAVAEAALTKGVPLFVEKPFTTDASSARRLADAAPGRVFVMDKWRYHPGIEALAAVARAAELGTVLAVETLREGPGTDQVDVDAFWTLIPHDLSIASEILGTLPPLLTVRTETHAAPGRQRLSARLGPVPGFSLDISIGDAAYRREVHLLCSAGRAWMADPYADHILLAREPEGPAERCPVSTEPPLLRELRSFVGYLDGGPPPRGSAAEGALIVALTEQIRRHPARRVGQLSE